MDPEDIKDVDSLKAWLETQPLDACIALGHRAAMRVAPLFWRCVPPVAVVSDFTAEPILRACIVTTNSKAAPKQEAFEAGRAASRVAKDMGTFAGAQRNQANPGENYAPFYMAASYSAFTASDAAFAPPASVDASARNDVYNAIDSTRRTLQFAEFETDMWLPIVVDARILSSGENPNAILSQPLWPNRENPLDLAWGKVRAGWTAAEPDWQFWIDWYEDALAGREPDWDLLHDIALIPDDDWNAGADHVNALIADLVKQRAMMGTAIDQTPNAEHIMLDPDTGQIKAVPVDDIDGDLKQHVLESIKKAIDRFDRACAAPGANLGPSLADAVGQDLEYLREDIADAGGSNLRLHDALEDCLGAMRRILHDRGLEGDRYADRLIGTLDRCATDILGNAPSVKEVIEKRREEFFLRLSLEQKIEFDQLCADMARDSAPLLKEWMLADIARANDETADPDLRRRSRYNLVSRLPRGARAVRYSRFEDGRRVIEDDPKPAGDSKLWAATVLGPIGSTLLAKILGL